MGSNSAEVVTPLIEALASAGAERILGSRYTDLARFPEARFWPTSGLADQPLTMRRTRSEELGAVD